uniref:Uncharacterized protein n=1 Tax=Acrobeloides nanus TaxID=290746 RepID=A0A914D330_9BILA
MDIDEEQIDETPTALIQDVMSQPTSDKEPKQDEDFVYYLNRDETQDETSGDNLYDPSKAVDSDSDSGTSDSDEETSSDEEKSNAEEQESVNKANENAESTVLEINEEQGQNTE